MIIAHDHDFRQADRLYQGASREKQRIPLDTNKGAAFLRVRMRFNE